jgi:hypothetical protein
MCLGRSILLTALQFVLGGHVLPVCQNQSTYSGFGCGIRLQVHISYLEIYNEVGYDLLDPTREVQAMEDLPQVRGVRAGELQSAC